MWVERMWSISPSVWETRSTETVSVKIFPYNRDLVWCSRQTTSTVFNLRNDDRFLRLLHRGLKTHHGTQEEHVSTSSSLGVPEDFPSLNKFFFNTGKCCWIGTSLYADLCSLADIDRTRSVCITVRVLLRWGFCSCTWWHVRVRAHTWLPWKTMPCSNGHFHICVINIATWMMWVNFMWWLCRKLFISEKRMKINSSILIIGGWYF